MRHTLKIAVALVVFAGCGGDTPQPRHLNGADQPVPPITTAYTKEQVRDRLHLYSKARNGSEAREWEETNVLGLYLTDDCQEATVLTTPGEIRTYVDGGDAMAMNPSGTVGIKVTGEVGCVSQFQSALKKALP